MPDPTWDADTLVARYDEVRAHTETLAAPAVARGPDRPVDARRVADEVAPRPRHVVLRDVRARRPRAVASRPSRTSTGSSSTATTRASGRATPAPSAASSPGPAPTTSALYRADVDARMRDLVDHARRRLARASSRRTIELGFHHEQQHQELLLMDIKHVLSVNPLQPAYAGTPARAVRSRPAGLGRRRGRPGRGRVTTAAGSASTTSCRGTSSGSSRTASPTGSSPTASGWSSWPTAATSAPSCGSPTAGPGCAAEGWRAPFYWREVDGVWFEHTLQRHPPGRPRAAGVPRQLLRGRRLRHVGRQAAADRGRVGARRRRRRAGRRVDRRRQPRRHRDVPPARRRPADRSPAPGLRRLLGVDELGLPRLPRLPPAGRRDRRVQRQVHVRPDGAARRLRPDAARPRPRDLPQLLPAGLALGAVRRPPRRRG